MLLSSPLTLKEYIAQYKCDKEIFDLKKRHDIEELETEFASKNFFTNNFIVDVFVFCNSNNIDYFYNNNYICHMQTHMENFKRTIQT